MSIEKLNTTQETENPAITYAESLSEEDIIKGNYDSTKFDRKPDEFILDKSDYKRFPLQTVFDSNAPRSEKTGQLPKRKANLEETANIMLGSTQKTIYNIDSLDQEKYPFPDEIIYLDKSGRPVSWLVSLFWDEFARKDGNGNVINQRPRHSYVNIDRNEILRSFFGMRTTGGTIHSPEGDKYDSPGEAWGKAKDRLSEEHLAQLRALYLEGDIDDVEDMDPKTIMGMRARLDGKNILIIDEVSSAYGTTLKMAKELFSKAFPGSNVRSLAFWPETAEQSVPVWYDDKITEGRGAGEIDPQFYEEKLAKYSDPDYFRALGVPEDRIEQVQHEALSRTRKQYIGRKLLSIPLNLENERQRLTRNLADDFEQLYKDYREHKILPYWFSVGISAADRRRGLIETIRQGILPQQLMSLKKDVFSKNNPQYPKK